MMMMIMKGPSLSSTSVNETEGTKFQSLSHSVERLVEGDDTVA